MMRLKVQNAEDETLISLISARSTVQYKIQLEWLYSFVTRLKTEKVERNGQKFVDKTAY